MHGITCPEQQEGVKLVTTEVYFEGTNIQTLLDTRSPVTIVSAKFLFQALAKHRFPNQTVEEWKDSVRKRIQYSSVKLQSYDAGQLNIIGQIEVKLERGSHKPNLWYKFKTKLQYNCSLAQICFLPLEFSSC